MSAFIGILSQTFAILSTDTLSTYPVTEGDIELQPRSYTSKTFLLPQFKSAFAVTGTLQAGLYFFNFVTELAYGIDIDSLVNIDLKLFISNLEKSDGFPIGSLYLTGYSEQSKSFKSFKLFVDPSSDFNWQQLEPENFIFKPIVENWEQKLFSANPQADYQQFIISLMKLQKQEDEQKPLNEQVGIGGEITYTQLGLDEQTENLIIITQLIYQFQDYKIIGSKMTRK